MEEIASLANGMQMGIPPLGRMLYISCYWYEVYEIISYSDGLCMCLSMDVTWVLVSFSS